MLAESIVEGLNPEQRAAVETTEGPLLVIAGAGSGKTRVLTHRIAYLIGVCGIAPESIFAVTFTNKAAGEMRERVHKLLGLEAENVWLSTFHSACVRILRRDIGHLGRSRGFVIYDESDSLGVVKEALRRHGLESGSQRSAPHELALRPVEEQGRASGRGRRAGGRISMRSGPRRSTRSISGCSPTPTPSTSATCCSRPRCSSIAFRRFCATTSGAGSTSWSTSTRTPIACSTGW